MLAKKKFNAWGKDTYLLGRGQSGDLYYLEAAKFECGWYYGGGYVRTYTNPTNPSRSRDITSHNHFDSMFFHERNGFDNMKDFFAETVLTEKETWQLLELMKAFYTARKYSDMLYIGGAHYTNNPAKETIKNNTEYNRINKEVIPAIMDNVYRILSPEQAG